MAAAFDDLTKGAVRGRSADHVRPGYSTLAVGSHLVFYRQSGSDAIEVVRILHRRMDVDRHL